MLRVFIFIAGTSILWPQAFASRDYGLGEAFDNFARKYPNFEQLVLDEALSPSSKAYTTPRYAPCERPGLLVLATAIKILEKKMAETDNPDAAEILKKAIRRMDNHAFATRLEIVEEILAVQAFLDIIVTE